MAHVDRAWINPVGDDMSAVYHLILLPSNVAVNRILDTSPHEDQAVTNECLKRIGEILDGHPHMKV